ncbi:MAG: SMC-Scp complex subunit ScpB, partial [Planctomycetales bacterium]|nr:SMC-Scp complex subunit ScpB [Planctomycetales bacterium]
QAAVDCLAIVAYHQPIERDLVEKLRGQNSGSLLSQLVRRELLQVEVTNERPRKKLYRTTDRFLDLFGLDCLADLPSHDDF